MNIIDERDKRNETRRRMKQMYDSTMTLSADEKWYPLLSEGMITYADGSPQFYIMKGTISSFYDQLSPSYEGSINIGHTDLASFPERIVGKWTKADLRVVDTENGRQALETSLPINYDHPLIKALELSPFDVGLSVEMGVNVNESLTNNKDANPFGVPMVDNINVYDYAIVGNAGDVNSMGITLRGELPQMDEKLKKLASLLADSETTTLSDVSKLLDETLEEAEKAPEAAPEAVEELAEEPKEEVVEEAENAPEEVVEASEEAVEEKEVEVKTDSSELDAILASIEELKAEIESLKAQVTEKDALLAAKDKETADFVNKFKNLSVSLTKEVKPMEKPKSQYTDGIGE